MKLPSGTRLNAHPSGRHFLQIPGPTNVPDRVLRAIDHPTIDHRGPEFGALGLQVIQGMQRIFRTRQPVVIYPASGTGAWEAALVNTLSPGDQVLMFETGHFASLWSKLAKRLQLDPQMIPADWRSGVDANQIESALKADTGQKIRAVCVVHNETSTGVTSDIAAVRKAIDAVGHPALLMVDTISSLASIVYEHDKWGVDVTVGGSQKGLMLPPGLSFNALSERAIKASENSKQPLSYWAWDEILAANKNGYWPSTPATNLLYGLAEAIDMLEEEGLDNVFARHQRHARAARAAVNGWGLELLCQNPSEYSGALTAVLMPGHEKNEHFSADELRSVILKNFNMSLGTGLGKLAGKVFRIGHLGDFNDLSLMGTLSGVQMGLSLAGVSHQSGGVQAAMDSLTNKG